MTISIPLRRICIVATGASLCLACGTKSEERPPSATEAKPVVAVVDEVPAKATDESLESTTASVTAQPVSAKKAFEARAVTHLPLPEKLTMYALEPSRISIAGVDEPRNSPLQDDNLLTHVTCDVQEGAPCEVEVRFEKTATVSAVRLFSGDGGTRKAYRASGRAARVRIVTEQGAADATMEKHRDYATILLSKPVKTASVRLSVLDIYGPKKIASVTLSELDVLGVEGTARPPLRLERKEIYTKADRRFWRGGRFSDAWMEQTDLKGNRQRLFRGTRVYGASKQRFYLAERIVKASCPGAMYYEERRYTVVDSNRRMFYSLPQQTAGSDTVLLRQRGEGFFFRGYDLSGENLILSALMFDGDTVRRDSLAEEEEGQIRRHALSLGFSADVNRFDVSEPSVLGSAVPCKPLRKRTAILRKAESQLKIANKSLLQDGYWERCEVPEDRTLFLLRAVCSEETESAIVVRLKNGELVTQSFGVDAWLELRVTGDGSVRISAERRGGAGGDIYDLQEDGTLKKIIPDALFTPGADPGCRCSA